MLVPAKPRAVFQALAVVAYYQRVSACNIEGSPKGKTGLTYVLGAEGLDLLLGTVAGILGGLVGVAHVGELVAHTVCDDIRVEGLFLSLVDERVDGLEGELGVLAAV